MHAPRRTISQAARLLRSGAVTPRSLVEKCLEAIDRFDGEIRAWVMVDRQRALADADRLGQMLKSGNSCGPLHGIPWGIKDIVDVSGLPTRCGSAGRPEQGADRDAEIVAQLRTAGAIILGKTVTTEFACFDPPPTRNPWNLAHTPGGSSSGSAAAVAAGMCFAAIGSQTGGSINRPASYCGVAGFKPTFGHISRKGVFPVSDRLDHVGPIGSTVADLQLFQEAVFGAPRGRTLPLRWLTDFSAEHTAASVHSTTSRAIDQLRKFCPIDRAPDLPSAFSHVHEHHFRIMAVEAAQVHRDQWQAAPSTFGPNLTSLIETGLATSDTQYAESKAHQVQFCSELDGYLREQGALLLPATPTSAPASLNTTGDPLFNSPWSYGGFPAVNFPCGLDASGMPCGLQVVGARGCDDDLLQTAAWCEHHIAQEINELPFWDLADE